MTLRDTWIVWAEKHGACTGAMEWLRSLPDDADPWAVCSRSDWMLWALHMAKYRAPDALNGPRAFACDCTERALQRERDAGREPDPRSWRAVEVAREYLRGDATAEEMAAARDAAWDAEWAAAWAAAWAASDASAAAWAVARAAVSAAARDAAWDAAWDAEWAAAWAARDASAAAWTASAAASAEESRWQADRIRHYVPEVKP